MLRILSFNVSGLNASQACAPGFSLHAKHAWVAQLVLQHAPHLVSLQELSPGGAELLTAALSPSYLHVGAAPSHCGATYLWALASLQPTAVQSEGPVAIASLPLAALAAQAASSGDAQQAAALAALPDAPSLYFAGCHLEPFTEGAPMRLQQVKAALGCLPAGCRLVLAGDMNMRVKENAAVEALGLGDAWVQAGSPKEHNYTWNSRINKYHGEDAFAYIARYDRVYLRGLAATGIQIVANQPVTPGGGDYLSDHFGLLCTATLT